MRIVVPPQPGGTGLLRAAAKPQLAVVAAVLIALAATAARGDDDFEGGTIIFQRGAGLWRVDARGKGETQVATLPAGTTARALRTDAAGSVLLADVDGAWQWMALAGSGTGSGSGSDAGLPTLRDLPCAAGPAQLADDGSCVVCASKADPTRAALYNFARDRVWPLDVPVATARLAVGNGARTLVWADSDGVWAAPVNQLANRTKVAPDAPLHGFLASPDGARGIAVYADEVYTDAHHTKPADVLMGFALDGTAARRHAGQGGAAIEWTHDGQWVLIQDGAQGCELRATGGEYKCFSGYAVESAATDGRWLVLLGPSSKGKGGGLTIPAPNADGLDVPVSLPSRPFALYRGKLEGLYKESPTLIVSAVDGAAVWVPHAP
jgi:hypothetical protein